MTREIKFRAWDRRINVMYPFVILGWNGNIEARLDQKDVSSMNDIRLEHKDGGFDDYDGGIEVMQYTGLKDRNGVEIYEGDVVKIHNFPNDFKRGEPDFDWRIFEVQWNQTNYAFNNSVIYSPFSRYNGKTLEDYDIEVIGNIYQNPELIK